MHLRAKRVVPHREGVGIAAGGVVRLGDADFVTLVGQERPDRQRGIPRAYNEVVVLMALDV